MKQLVCEMCGGTDWVKEDGMFVCQGCGMKYSAEEAKKMMGTVEISAPKTVVKVDNSDELANLYQLARRAREDENNENAARYYDMILIKDPTSWEATFYVLYCKAMTCKIAGIEAAGRSMRTGIKTVLELINTRLDDKEEQKAAYIEVSKAATHLSYLLFENARKHYFNYSNPKNFTSELIGNCFEAMYCVYVLGDTMEEMFGSDKEAQERAVIAWKQGINEHKLLLHIVGQNSSGNQSEIEKYATKIRKYDPDYVVTEIQNPGGCYVATAVYGSYDCPQVWTLRRYRDDTLAVTWYGRAFIHIYYAVSPTLVKWFGETRWFKNMWRGKLDRMVADLQRNGVESTPYEDRNW